MFLHQLWLTECRKVKKCCTNCGAFYFNQLGPQANRLRPRTAQQRRLPRLPRQWKRKLKSSNTTTRCTAYNDSANPNTSQKPHKRDKKIIAVATLVIILVVGGVGPLLISPMVWSFKQENKPEQTLVTRQTLSIPFHLSQRPIERQTPMKTYC